MKRIILISGWARSGKDFTADIVKKALVADYGQIEHMSFADVMKDLVAGTFGITRSQLDKFKNDPKTYTNKTVSYAECGSGGLAEYDYARYDFREILQRFGTEVMKPVFGKDVWTDLMHKKLQNSNAKVIVISDWRFKQELYRLRNLNFSIADDYITVRVEREGQVQESTHISEIDLDEDIDFDYTIKNDGVTISLLEEQVRDMLKAEGI